MNAFRLPMFVSAVAMTLAVGCGGSKKEEMPEPEPAPATEAPKPSMQTQVRQALDSAAGLDASQIQIRIEEGGRVFLSGLVPNAAHKERAEKVVTAIEGVKTVNVIDLNTKE
jgi:osmotically-inducible protein OsmY